MIVVTLGPLFLSILLGSFAVISNAWNGGRHRELRDSVVTRSRNATNSYAYMFLLLTFLVLVGTSTVLFHYFKCHEFEEVEDEEKEFAFGRTGRAPVSFMYKDYSINCNSERYDIFGWYAIIMIGVYPVGIPMLYAVLIWRQREFLKSKEKMKTEDSKEKVGHILFLVSHYETKCYWFEVLDCVRRLLLASIIGLVSEASAVSPVLGLLISIFFTWIFTEFKPYKYSNDNLLSILLAYSLCLFFLAALMIKVDLTGDDKDDQALFATVLIVLLFLGPMLLLFQSVYALFCQRGKSSAADNGANCNDGDRDRDDIAQKPKKHKMKRRVLVVRLPLQTSFGFVLTTDGGTRIKDVAANSPAQQSGLMPGDLITAVNDEIIRSPTDLKDALKTLIAEKIDDTVVLTISRSENSRSSPLRELTAREQQREESNILLQKQSPSMKSGDSRSTSNIVHAGKPTARTNDEEQITEGSMFQIDGVFSSAPSSNKPQARRRSSLELLVGGTTSAIGNLGSMVASVGFADEEDIRSPSHWHRAVPSTTVGRNGGRDRRHEQLDMSMYLENDEGLGTQI